MKDSKLSHRNTTQQGLVIHLTLLGLAFHAVTSAADEAGKVEFFEKRIRPILAQDCYECHSEAHKAKGGLLLDTREGWRKGGDSGASIVPGDVAGSLLLQTIRHKHEDLEMPKAGAKLEEGVIADFEKWIAEGAVDPRDQPPTSEEIANDTEWSAISERRSQWWSFQPVENPDIPVIGGSQHPIDRFLSAKREGSDIPVAQTADRWTILRRLHYTLTGLPATLEEMTEFDQIWEQEGRESAVAKTTDRLLNSPHFGERWGQHWLDWFRYTEGHGGQGDPVNENATEYRDYIIRALNANVAYDQLIREHLAGDLLEDPRLDPSGTVNESIMGLAQFRFVEHGFFPVDALDELVKFTDNQIDVVSKATMGLTVSCARCHDHKFDAISHADYHAMFGIFASSRPGHRQVLAPGVIDKRRDELEIQKAELAAAIKVQWLDETDTDSIRKRLDQFVERHDSAEENPVTSIKTNAGEEQLPQNFIVRPGDAFEPWIRWQDETKLSSQWKAMPQRLAKLKEEAEAHNQGITVAHYDFRNGIPDGWMVTDGTVTEVKAGSLGIATGDDRVLESILPAGVITQASTALEQAALFSDDFIVEFGAIAAEWSGAGWSQFRMVTENFPRPGGIYRQNESRGGGETRWFSEQADFWDGRRAYFQFNTRGLAPAPPRGPRGPDKKFVSTKAHPYGSWFHVREVRKLKSENDKIRRSEFPATVVATSSSKAPVNRTEMAELYTHAIRETVERWRTDAFTDEDALFLTECLEKGILSRDLEGLGDAVKEKLLSYRTVEEAFAAAARRSVPGVVESAGFDQAFYPRGNFNDPGAPVPRGFLEALDPEPFELSNETGRMQLAERITSRENPFFSRVIANRLWKHVFGQGLVRTPDNFGRTGERPTHPALLDHLASRMKDDGYDIKETLGYLITSELFQLSSQPTVEAAATDPENRLWSHMQLRRYDAEVVRDHLLSVSGNLSPAQFGPSVVPTVSPAQDLRRGIYVARKRKGRNAFLDTFDMPLPTTTRGARDVTTTPSQAITMLNSPFVRYQGQSWAEEQKGKSVSESLRSLVMRAYSRPATESELAALTNFYQANGGGPAGLTETAHLVFNSKEFIYLK